MGGIKLSVVALVLAPIIILLSPSPLLRTSIWYPTTVLTPVGSMASVVTSIILIMIVIVYIFILLFLLMGRGRWLKLLLRFSLPLPFFPPLPLVFSNGWGKLTESWSWDCAMCEYKLGTAPVSCAMGEAIVSWSHHLITCSKFLAFLVTSAQLGQ